MSFAIGLSEGRTTRFDGQGQLRGGPRLEQNGTLDGPCLLVPEVVVEQADARQLAERPKPGEKHRRSSPAASQKRGPWSSVVCGSLEAITTSVARMGP